MRAAQTPCFHCSRPVEGNYVEVLGWARARAAGGLNTLLAKRPTGRQACDDCGYKIRRGISLDQQSLL